MLQRAIARNAFLQQRLAVLGQTPLPPPLNPLLLKARKNFDLPTDCVSSLNSTRYKKLSPKTIKLLLSKHAKKKPFWKMSFEFKKIHTFSKTIASYVKKYSYHSKNKDPRFQKSDDKLLRLLASSYKRLEYLNANHLDIQTESSLYSLAKMNRLQNLSMKLHIGKPIPSPRLFRNLQRLQSLKLSITESHQTKKSDLVQLGSLFHSLALLSSLESYTIDIRTEMSEESGHFVGTLLYYISLLKAKRFSVTVRCSEEIDLNVKMFRSLLENIDTLEYKYSGATSSPNAHFKAPTSKKLILLLKLSKRKQLFISLVNSCTSLENLYFEQGGVVFPLTDAPNFPQALKTLTLGTTNFNSPETFKFWENVLSNLNNLENLSFLLKHPKRGIQEWISHLPKHASFKNLKQYHLKLEGDTSRQFQFQTEWSKSIQGLSSLEGLSFDITCILLKSLDFFTETMASLPKLKNIKLNLLLHNSQPKQTLMFRLPPQNFQSIEHIWLDASQYLSKDSAAKLLQDIAKCENLQSLHVSGLVFNEETAFSTLKGLPQLRALKIETDTRGFLTLNSKKEIMKLKAKSSKKQMFK